MAHNFIVVKSWTTTAGLDACVLLVNETHHCGYVAVPDALQGKDLESESLHVHGGVTYQGTASWSEGREVVGYDCAHAGDMMKCPAKHKGTELEHLSMYGHGVWRDEEYCIKQCEGLAKQLMELVPSISGPV